MKKRPPSIKPPELLTSDPKLVYLADARLRRLKRKFRMCYEPANVKEECQVLRMRMKKGRAGVTDFQEWRTRRGV
jgi:hypothetical protein